MRTNLPVTDIEYPLRDGTCIVSRTDLKGRITYVNQDFLEYSGFAEDELIGKAHNIVRHPDMPEEGAGRTEADAADEWRARHAADSK